MLDVKLIAYAVWKDHVPYVPQQLAIFDAFSDDGKAVLGLIQPVMTPVCHALRLSHNSINEDLVQGNNSCMYCKPKPSWNSTTKCHSNGSN